DNRSSWELQAGPKLHRKSFRELREVIAPQASSRELRSSAATIHVHVLPRLQPHPLPPSRAPSPQSAPTHPVRARVNDELTVDM
ncbi:MAG TPA: hypothetical protein VER33_25245, partial [Polyangiaceae bacterium]|nr:hypothetical protein [Polyangiaceae bacterium]